MTHSGHPKKKGCGWASRDAYSHFGWIEDPEDLIADLNQALG